MVELSCGAAGRAPPGAASGPADGAAAPVAARLADGTRIRAQQVVLAAGAWTNDLLRLLGRELDLCIWSMLWGHYQITQELRCGLSWEVLAFCAVHARGHASVGSWPRFCTHLLLCSQSLPQWYCFRKSQHSTEGSHSGAACSEAAQAASSDSSGGGSSTWDGGLVYGFPPERPGECVAKVDYRGSPTSAPPTIASSLPPGPLGRWAWTVRRRIRASACAACATSTGSPTPSCAACWTAPCAASGAASCVRWTCSAGARHVFVRGVGGAGTPCSRQQLVPQQTASDPLRPGRTPRPPAWPATARTR